MKTHKELYPEQYKHQLCGEVVTVAGKAGMVERVINSRFGQLAILDRHEEAYLVSDCKTVDIWSIEQKIADHLKGKEVPTDFDCRCFVGMIQTGEATEEDFEKFGEDVSETLHYYMMQEDLS